MVLKPVLCRRQTIIALLLLRWQYPDIAVHWVLCRHRVTGKLAQLEGITETSILMQLSTGIFQLGFYKYTNETGLHLSEPSLNLAHKRTNTQQYRLIQDRQPSAPFFRGNSGAIPMTNSTRNLQQSQQRAAPPPVQQCEEQQALQLPCRDLHGNKRYVDTV